jgi:hypothetical protein
MNNPHWSCRWSGPALVALACATSLAGCGGSLLLGKGDASYARSVERYARSSRQVQAVAAGEEETFMFLQAEAFYRYRFEPPSRNAGTYVAQAVAAAIDLPVLQAFASSLDLFDLRLKMNDGAIQIWESLLERHPGTPLRPLTLYRLGWAYRYRITPGFPREEPDQAFDLLIADYPTSPLLPLVRDAKTVPWKSQDVATELSLLPGLGQIYAGEKLNGAAKLSVAAIAGAMVLAPAIIGYSRWRDDQLTWSRDWPLLATAIGGLIVFSVDYTLAYEDALRAVMQYNERQERSFDDRHADAP